MKRMKYVFAGTLLLLVGIATVASQKESRLAAETTVREFTTTH